MDKIFEEIREKMFELQEEIENKEYEMEEALEDKMQFESEFTDLSNELEELTNENISEKDYEEIWQGLDQ